MVVELHTERTSRHFPVPPDLDDLASHLTPVTLAGREVLTFAPEDMLPILCIHGSKHIWERLSWIADISEFIQSQPRLDWDSVFHRADRLRARRMLHVGLALASKLLDAPLPPEILSRVQSDRVASLVALEVERRTMSRDWPRARCGAAIPLSQKNGGGHSRRMEIRSAPRDPSRRRGSLDDAPAARAGSSLRCAAPVSSHAKVRVEFQERPAASLVSRAKGHCALFAVSLSA